MTSDLIEHLPAALSSASLVLVIAAVLPKILDRVPKIIDACALLLLVRALVKRLGNEPENLVGLSALIRDLRAPPVIESPEDGAQEPEPGEPSPPAGK